MPLKSRARVIRLRVISNRLGRRSSPTVVDPIIPSTTHPKNQNSYQANQELPPPASMDGLLGIKYWTCDWFKKPAHGSNDSESSSNPPPNKKKKKNCILLNLRRDRPQKKSIASSDRFGDDCRQRTKVHNRRKPWMPRLDRSYRTASQPAVGLTSAILNPPSTD